MALSQDDKILLGVGAAVIGLGFILATKKQSPAGPLSTQGKGSISWWTDDDFRAFAEMSQRLKMNPADLLIVLYSESGLRPNARNPADVRQPAIAIGLNQIVRSTAHALGMSDVEWQSMLSMSVNQQLPYVERYFRNIPWVHDGNTFQTAAQVYEANFAPAFLSRGADPNIVLYRKEQGLSYSLNKGFDRENKGYITLGDLGKAVERNSKGATFLAALDRLRSVTGDPNLSPNYYLVA